MAFQTLARARNGTRIFVQVRQGLRPVMCKLTIAKKDNIYSFGALISCLITIVNHLRHGLEHVGIF